MYMEKVYEYCGISVYRASKKSDHIAIDELGNVLFIFKANEGCIFQFETTSSYCYNNKGIYDEIINAVLELK